MSVPSSLNDNLAKGIPKCKCKDCTFCLEHVTANNGSRVFKCVNCHRNCEKEFNNDLAKKIVNINSVTEALTYFV